MIKRQPRNVGPELDGLTQHLLGLFLRLQREERARTADRIDKAVETMNRDFARPLSMAELALECGYSEGHFYRSFHQRTGKTPKFPLAERQYFLERIRYVHRVVVVDASACVNGAKIRS